MGFKTKSKQGGYKNFVLKDFKKYEIHTEARSLLEKK